MKLSALLSDGLVLQRDKENVIWGYDCIEGEEILIRIDGKEVVAVADKNGTFQKALPKVEAGGPYILEIGDVTLRDVLCGDVYLLSGQSNMEIPINRTLDMYEDVAKKMNFPNIHYFEVPKECRFDQPGDDLEKGKWIPALQENIYPMSALGLFFAEMVQRDEKVPVGLIQTGVGGSHIEAFLSEERIRKVGKILRKKAVERGEDISSCNCNKNDSCKVCYEKQLLQNKDAEFVAKTMEAEAKDQSDWYEIVNSGDIGLKEKWENKTSLFEDGEEPQYVTCPGRWEGLSEHAELEDVRGAIWLLKTVEVPKHWLDQEVRLYLGTLVDADETYVNGTLVGQTGYRYPPRRYRIPAGVLKEGKNTIVIRLIANARAGGFVEESPYFLSLENPWIGSGETQDKANPVEMIPIDGKWQFKVTSAINRGFDREMEDVTFFNWKPTALYNQMLYPLRKLKIKGILFYQGESNVSHAWEYEDLLVEMTEGIRELFGENLPIGLIQLPMFGGEDDFRGTTTWDDLRQSQALAAGRIDHSVLVDIYDLGFKYELHPQNKKEVAKRLYEAMRTL